MYLHVTRPKDNPWFSLAVANLVACKDRKMKADIIAALSRFEPEDFPDEFPKDKLLKIGEVSFEG